MPIYTETIINRWFNDEKNLKILNGIVRHLSDKQIAKETGLRIDRIANYRSKLKKKGLLSAGFFTLNYEKLGLVQLMDFPKELPSVDEIFLTYLVRISRPYGYLRARLLPPHMVDEGYHLGEGVDILNNFSKPFVIEEFRKKFEEIFGKIEINFYQKNHNVQINKVDLLSIYVCKEIQKGNYGARSLSKAISSQIGEEELGIQPSISNVNRRLSQLKKGSTICKSNPLNLVPLRPYYNLDSAIVKKTEHFTDIIAALAYLNVIVRYNDILNEPNKAYLSLQYHYSQKWDILGILKKYLENFTFFDHSPLEIKRTIPFEYFKNIFIEKGSI
jgi:hypothetical protein